MSRFIHPALAALLVAAAACSDTSRSLAPDRPDLAEGPTWQEPPDPDRARDQRLARRFALALNSPAFRTEVLEAIQRSGQRERRLHLQRFLLQQRARGLDRVATTTLEAAARIRADLQAAPSMEVYLPVPRHRELWQGGTNVLVATARADGEIPVAFDLRGRKHLLDPRRPPETPVIALQAWEGDDRAECMAADQGCGGWDDDGWREPPPQRGGTPLPPNLTAGGVFLFGTRFFDTFEGWLKGAPEFEIHILGQKTGTTEMVSYQCIGERAGVPYHWNQDDLTWSGSVMLFSQKQLDDFEARHPGQGLRILVIEDDDGPCEIKVNKDRATQLFKAADQAYDAWTSGKQVKFTDFSKQFTRAKSFYQLVTGLASFFLTNDDIVGTAIHDPGAAGAILSGANWIVKNEKNVATGALRLEMR